MESSDPTKSYTIFGRFDWIVPDSTIIRLVWSVPAAFRVRWVDDFLFVKSPLVARLWRLFAEFWRLHLSVVVFQEWRESFRRRYRVVLWVRWSRRNIETHFPELMTSFPCLYDQATIWFMVGRLFLPEIIGIQFLMDFCSVFFFAVILRIP